MGNPPEHSGQTNDLRTLPLHLVPGVAEQGGDETIPVLLIASLAPDDESVGWESPLLARLLLGYIAAYAEGGQSNPNS